MSVLHLVKMWEDIVQQKVSLVCFKEGCDEIVGLNLCAISSKEDPEIQFERVHIMQFFF